MATTVSFATDGFHYWPHDGIQIFHITNVISIVVNNPGWTLETKKGRTSLISGKPEHFDSNLSFKIHSPTEVTTEYAPLDFVQPLSEGEAARNAAMAHLERMADAGYGKGAETKSVIENMKQDIAKGTHE